MLIRNLLLLLLARWDVRILVNVYDVPGSDLLNNICHSEEWHSVASCVGNFAGHHDTGAYPLAIGFLDE
jgi:hypothetical protein